MSARDERSDGEDILVRPVRRGDEAELTAMIHELAEFENASAECTVSESQLGEALFDKVPADSPTQVVDRFGVWIISSCPQGAESDTPVGVP